VPEIVANSVLPAKREIVHFPSMDGTVLVGEIATPIDKAPIATIICLHPLPTHGGYMDSHVFRKMAWRLPALADLAIFRFNFRGVESAAGKSQGEFSAGAGEGLDAQAAIAYALERGLPNIYVVGWSFGTDVAIRFANISAVKEVVLLSPPLRWTDENDLAQWKISGKPLTALIPEFDDFLRPQEAREKFSVVPQAQIVQAPDAKHLWVGEKNVKFALNEIVKKVAPNKFPLPLEWDGPMEKWSDL
jgi:alpha/beta superfamily hydrolase